MSDQVQAGTKTGVLDYRGCRLSFRRGGHGPPVLLIQGVGLHGDGWTPQVDALRSRFTCLTFDNRGVGLSQPATTPLSVEAMADDVLALMDHLGWKSAHVVGHSLGGVIAQHLTLAAPTRVRSLSLLCTVSRGSDATKLSGRMLWLGIRSSVGTLPMRRRAFLQIVMPPGVLESVDVDDLARKLQPIFGHDLGTRPPIAMKQLGALRRYDATPRLKELASVPCLVVSAEHDPIAPPAFGRALAAGIPKARYVEIPGASHGVTIQMAGRINELLAEHMTAAEGRYQEAPGSV